MHTSEELSQVMSVMYRQLEDLQINNVSCELILCDDDRDVLQYWSATVIQTTIPEPFNIPRSLDPFFEKQWQAWKKGEDRLVIIVEGKEKKAYDKLLLEKSEFRNFPLEIQELIRSRKKDVFTHACLKYGLLESVGDEPLSDTDFQILKRFAKVFDQAYTRFLDLQKAEAQAREAQIEAALERVRSRTMAMHKTDELLEAAELVGRELSALGVTSMNVSYAFVDEDEKHAAYYSVNPVDGKIISFPFVFPHTETKVMRSILSSWKKQDPFTMIELDELATLKHQTWVGGQIQNLIIKNNSGIPFSIEAFLAVSPKKAVIYTFNFKQGYLFKIGGERLTTAQEELVLRFTKVFEMTYRRFLDLKQAEQQTREAQIELGLERVRARAMAMQNSDELKELIGTVFIELTKLDLVLTRCLIMIYDTQTNGSTWWMANSEAPTEPISLYVKNHQLPPYAAYIKAWKERKNKWQYLLEGKNKNSWDDFLFAETELSKLPDFVIAGMKAPDRVCLSASFNNFGCLNLATLEPLSGEHFDLLLRFAKVFDLTYTRFNDLQKAEAQAREAKIELGLERVRARAMAMQKSDELSELVDTVLKELTKLDFALNWCIINIIDEPSLTNMVWAANPETNKPPESYLMKFEDYPFHHSMLNGYRERKTKHVYVIEGEEKTTYDNYLFNETEWRRVPKAAQDASRAMKRYVATFTFSNFGGLQTVGEEYLSEQNLDILSRFGKVFDLTYTRFNDLQKAEAQAKEARIEISLERIRARALAMHKSDELLEVAIVMREQMAVLGQPDLEASVVHLYEEDPDHVLSWRAFRMEHEAHKEIARGHMPIPKNSCEFIRECLDKFYGDLQEYTIEVSGTKQDELYDVMARLAPDVVNSMRQMNSLHEKRYYRFSKFSGGALVMVSKQEPAAEAIYLQNRAAVVFDLAYRRFLDLQKAEAQAKEAKIEAALERVRSRSMGMQKSEELREVGNEIYKQLVQLNFDVEGDGFMLDYPGTDDWYAWGSDRWGAAPDQIHYPYINHPYWNRYKEAKEKGLEFFATNLTFEEKNTLFDHFFKYLPAYTPEVKKVIYASPGMATSHVFLKNVVLYVWNLSGIPYTDAENAIIMRFGKVFEQAYIRFNDLKKAEAQALEAIKRASVDRIRAEIASMRTTRDLERIQPLIWNELKTLGVPFIRCGVFIMDEEKKEVQTMLSTPEGKAIATLHVPFDFDLSIITNGVKYWRKKEIYKEHWDATEFIKTWTRLGSLRETTIDSPQAEHPPESLYINLLPFLQGMLYVGSDAPLNDDTLQLVQNLADAFSTAYARYEDFNKLEAAKQQVDKTLTDLKLTQQQLVQSEKMASLGELTAGIAHEIQNPLNFVNNFSEVSKELLDEMKEAIEKGDTKEAGEIMNDVIQNLEKINHHGKRADGIVKGMLQHSRSSSGTKEPTDINALADEYFRLAFHGLRAKDKSFNATLKTDYDESLEKVNVIPQDMGRVILNLITNAFYAVNEKMKSGVRDYDPIVTVGTKRNHDKVEVSVKDNGNGIPQKVLDKIFQPFFTTKPTGQGTGLGLSLAFDIVKAHGGELKVETKESEGTTFIIQLSGKNNEKTT